MLRRLESIYMAALQAAYLAIALGRAAELPDLGEMRQRFDERLAAPPEAPDPVDQQRAALLQAVGLRA